MQKRLDRLGDPNCSIDAHPTPGLILQKTITERNMFHSLSSVCEMVHKINRLHKPPKLVEFSTQKKEGKNEKDLYIHNYYDGTDSLYVTSGPDI
jgi:hypothetical protein